MSTSEKERLEAAAETRRLCRAIIAGLMMHRIINLPDSPVVRAKDAVRAADALLAELDRTAEDAEDLADARKAQAEARETGLAATMEELRAELEGAEKEGA